MENKTQKMMKSFANFQQLNSCPTDKKQNFSKLSEVDFIFSYKFTQH